MYTAVVRFLFGVGEARAYPGATWALYSWLPTKERGLGQGIFHSGDRVGAAASLVVMPWLIGQIGWRWTFVANGVVGLVWGLVWWFWYRDDPKDHPKVNEAEGQLVRESLAEEERAVTYESPYVQVVTSANVLLAMFQYAASNITFFVSITWLQPYMKKTWGAETDWMASIPLLRGAVALWVAGYTVTTLHRRGMTLSSSWAFCMDIGGSRSGAVSAAMNMVGNLVAALSAVAFPFFVGHVTLPFFAKEIGTANSFLVFAATMNVLALIAWIFMNPRRALKPISKGRCKHGSGSSLVFLCW